jgi:class 3 adenylate cyclase
MENLNKSNKQFPLLAFELRCVVHYEHVLEYQDINNNLNLAGKGINEASRMLSKTGKNQILVSDDFFTHYKDMDMIPAAMLASGGCFSESFPVKVKHDVELEARNFRDDSNGIGVSSRVLENN